MANRIPDPEQYRELSTPFESRDEAIEAFSNFFEGLAALRKKYKIPDLLIVVQVTALGTHLEGSPEGVFEVCMGWGNPVNELPLAAFAYGQKKAEHAELMSTILSGKSSRRVEQDKE